MAKRAIKLQYPAPKAEKPYIFVPIGMYLNVKLQKAMPGDIIEFQTDWRIDKRILIRKCLVAVSSSIFTFLMKSIYGGHMTWAELSQRWKAECIIEGLGGEAFDPENVMLIEVDNIPNDDL